MHYPAYSQHSINILKPTIESKNQYYTLNNDSNKEMSKGDVEKIRILYNCQSVNTLEKSK